MSVFKTVILFIIVGVLLLVNSCDSCYVFESNSLPRSQTNKIAEIRVEARGETITTEVFTFERIGKLYLYYYDLPGIFPKPSMTVKVFSANTSELVDELTGRLKTAGAKKRKYTFYDHILQPGSYYFTISSNFDYFTIEVLEAKAER